MPTTARRSVGSRSAVAHCGSNATGPRSPGREQWWSKFAMREALRARRSSCGPRVYIALGKRRIPDEIHETDLQVAYRTLRPNGAGIDMPSFAGRTPTGRSSGEMPGAQVSCPRRGRSGLLACPSLRAVPGGLHRGHGSDLPPSYLARAGKVSRQSANT